MSERKVVAKNTIFQFLGKLVTMLVTMGVTAAVTRFYGVEGYGIFSLIAGFPALFYIISDFGFNAIATRDLSVKESSISEYLGNIILIRVVICLVLFALASIILLAFNYPIGVKVGILFGLLTIFTSALYSTSNIGFQVKLRYDLSNLANSLGSLVVPLIIFLMIYYKAPIYYIGLANVISGIVVAVLCYYFLSKLSIIPKLKFDQKLVTGLFNSSLPIGLMFIFSQINFKADSIMLSVLPLPSELGLSNIQAVGIYGLPYKIFEVALVVPTFFMNSIYPIMVRHYSQSKAKLMQTFKKVMLILFAAGVMCGVVGIAFSDFAISVLGGSGFGPSVDVLKILLGFMFIFYLSQPIAWLIVTLGGQKHLPYIYLTASVVNLSLNYILIPKYSFFASANITWISELVILILLSLAAKKLVSK